MQLNKENITVSIEVQPVDTIGVKDRYTWIDATKEDRLTEVLEKFVKEVAFYPVAPDLEVSHCMKLDTSDDCYHWVISIPKLDMSDGDNETADVPIFFIDIDERVDFADGVDDAYTLGITPAQDFWNGFVVDGLNNKYVLLLGELLSRIIPEKLKPTIDVKLELSVDVVLSSLEIGIFRNVLPFDAVRSTQIDTYNGTHSSVTTPTTATVEFRSAIEYYTVSAGSGAAWEEKTSVQLVGLQSGPSNQSFGLFDLITSGRVWGVYDYKHLLSTFVDRAAACIERIANGDGPV